MLGLKESFRELVLVMHFLKHANMRHIQIFLQRIKICIYQSWPRRFVEVHNLAKKSKKGQAKMEQGMCQSKSSPKEIEYANEDKVNLLFLLTFLNLHFVFEFQPNIV